MSNRLAALRALDRVRARYEEEGYEVTVGQRLPSPFEGFQADAVARRDSETIIIEIRSSDMSDVVRNRFDRLADILASEAGWRVDLVTFDPEAPLPKPDTADVVRRVEEAQRVADLSPDASVLLTWSAVEGTLLDLQTRRDAVRRDLPPARQLILDLKIEGILSDAQADRLDRFAQLRHEIAHGLRSRTVDPDELDWVARFALAATEGQVATIENMIEWFRENYEPPDVADLPYDSEDGKYMWFDRGPHYVDDVLWEHFGSAIESDVTEAAEVLEYEGGVRWAKRHHA